MDGEFIELLVARLPSLAQGLRTTLTITAFAWLVMIGSGTMLAIARGYGPAPVRWIASGIVELFRGASALVFLFWAFYVLPHFNVVLPAMAVGILVLGVVEGSYASEAIRGALKAVPTGQSDAARVIGLSPRTCLRRIILPQALPTIIAPLSNFTISLLKFTAVLSFISINDLVNEARRFRFEVGYSAAIFGLLLCVYWALAAMINQISRFLERRAAIIGHGTDASSSFKRPMMID